MGKRVLVLAVDRDDDLGAVGIHTPLLGREQVLQAAIRFALYRPEDSDLNVLFAALRLEEDLKRKGYDAIVGVVAGSQRGGIEADLRIAEQTRSLVEKTGAEGIVFVSDGAEDEFVLPILQSIVPVLSVYRVVVEQHRGVEETYMLFIKYLRKAVEEPRFSRLLLGVPGIIVVVFSLLALLGLLTQALLLGLMVGGLAMIVKGFGLEDRLAEMWTRSPVMIVTSLIAVIGYAAAILLAYYMLYYSTIPPVERLVAALRGATGLIVFATLVLIVGHSLYKLAIGNYDLSTEITSLTGTLVLAVLLYRLADAIEAAGSLNPTNIMLEVVNYGVPWQAMAGVFVVGIVWWFSSKLFTNIIVQTSSPSEHSRAKQ